jgi:hypothetical protein
MATRERGELAWREDLGVWWVDCGGVRDQHLCLNSAMGKPGVDREATEAALIAGGWAKTETGWQCSQCTAANSA